MPVLKKLRGLWQNRGLTESAGQVCPSEFEGDGTKNLEARKIVRGSLNLRHVDAGSCNGCEIEITSSFGPLYDAGRFGVSMVASPRHADGVLVTGPVTRNMLGLLLKTIQALPEPSLVVALGDCARDCGSFKGAYGVSGAVGDFCDVDLFIPGCPPDPNVIVNAFRSITHR